MIYHSVFLNFGPSTPPSAELVSRIKQDHPEAIHPNRLAGIYSSRHSLWENLRKIDPEASLEKLQLKNYGELLHYPDVVISLSHSAIAGASALALKKEYVSIGIDIEPLERIVKASILGRVTTEKDVKLAPLSIWCLKEAIYKCVSNSGLYEGVLEFKDMEILDQRWNHSPSGLNGEWKLFDELHHRVALATLKNQNS